MLNEAERQVNNADIKNAKFVLRKAKDVTDDWGKFRLITMGASFHWMNQAEVLQNIYDLVGKDGGVVIVSDSSSPWRDQAEKWKKVRKEIVQKYLGEKRRAGNDFYKEPEVRFEDLLDASPFGGYKEWAFDYTQTWTLEMAINFLYSTSVTSRRLFGEKLKSFERELRTELLKIEPNGVFKEQIHVQALLARK